jgi:signal transduction histidine kinase
MSDRSTPPGLPAAVIDSQPCPDIALLYAEALRAGVADPGECALRRAYEVGREGFVHGVGLLELSTIHHQALARMGADRGEILRAGEFLAESLSPYEMALRGFREAARAFRKLNETLEREIQRIAHCVHDEAGQLLDAARLAISEVGCDVNPALQDRLRQVGSMLDRAENELRRLSRELRPMVLDDLGLVPALELLAEGISRRAGVRVRIENSLQRRPPATVETTLYRVVQEALTNVVRHSQARNVLIALASDGGGHLRCAVRDDGTGFDVAALASKTQPAGLGLLGIRERLNAVGGSMRIHSQPGIGTELVAEVLSEP